MQWLFAIILVKRKILPVMPVPPYSQMSRHGRLCFLGPRIKTDGLPPPKSKQKHVWGREQGPPEPWPQRCVARVPRASPWFSVSGVARGQGRKEGAHSPPDRMGTAASTSHRGGCFFPCGCQQVLWERHGEGKASELLELLCQLVDVGCSHHPLPPLLRPSVGHSGQSLLVPTLETEGPRPRGYWLSGAGELGGFASGSGGQGPCALQGSCWAPPGQGSQRYAL